MKTKLEIIDETEQEYSNPSNRALEKNICNGHLIICKYKTEDGKHCAFGRCCDNVYPEEGWAISLNFDFFLKEEYKGHSHIFWRDLQKFHDRDDHFTENSISEKGKEYLKKLREIYKN